MRFSNVETPTFAGSAGSVKAPAVAERMNLYDRSGSVVAFFNKAVDGTISFEVNGETYIASGAATVILDLPTVDPAVAGQLWADTGTVKVSAGA
jgi:hypothetical protein